MSFSSLLRRVCSRAYVLIASVVPVSRAYAFVSFPDVSDNAAEVFFHLAARCQQERRLVWLVSDIAVSKARIASRLEAAGAATVVKKNSLRGLWEFLRAEKVFFTHGHYWFVRSMGDKKLVNLWHGMPLKAIGLLDGKDPRVGQSTDVTISSSKMFQSIMADAFGLQLDDVIVSGLPRCDMLASKQVASSRLAKALEVEDARFVVWMPTYRISVVGDVRSDSSLSRESVCAKFEVGAAALAKLCGAWGFRLVIKLHPMDFLNQVDLSSIEGPSVHLLKANDKIFESIGLYDLLSMAHGLITDVSSVCFDFMVTKRPILITRDFEEEYTRGLLFDPARLFGAVYTCEDWQGADAFFEAMAQNRSTDAALVEDFCQFDDDKSTERLLRILSLMG